ncbi:MAG: hypothetical protein WC872_03150, partial [Candidatus Absconditabacterales bacterium]
KMLLDTRGIQKEGYKQVNGAFYEKFKKFQFIQIPCIIDIGKKEKIKKKYRTDSIKFVRSLKSSLADLILM